MVLMPTTMETRVTTLIRNIMARLEGSCLFSPRVRLCDVEMKGYDHLDRTNEQGQCSPGSLAGWIRHQTEARRRKAASVAAAHLFPPSALPPPLFNPSRNLHPPPAFGQCSSSLRQALCYNSGVNSVLCSWFFWCSWGLQRFHRRELLVLVNPIKGNPWIAL